MAHVEEISSAGRVLAYVVKAEMDPPESTFITDPSENFQVGLVVVPSGGEVVRHDHLPVERSIVGTSEALTVRKGRCEMDVYDGERSLVATVELRAGDAAVFLGEGAHGFRALEDTVLFEVKQGPFGGDADKERF